MAEVLLGLAELEFLLFGIYGIEVVKLIGILSRGLFDLISSFY